MTGAHADDQSEFLDDDRLPEEYPPDEPMAVNDRGTTAREEQTDEPLEQRMRRGRDDEPHGDASGVGRLVSPHEGAVPDDEAQAVATEVDRAPAGDRPVGQPAAHDRTVHETAIERGAVLSAEEAAMHEVPAEEVDLDRRAR